MVKTMQVTFSMKLPGVVKKSGRYYISSCPILDVHSQGETQKKALENLKEALRLFLMSCVERGTLDEVLRACGFKLIAKQEIKIQPFPRKYTTLEIPLPFQVPQRHDSIPWHA